MKKNAKKTIKTGYPKSHMLLITGNEPLDAAMAAIRELSLMQQSDEVKLKAMDSVVTLARSASVTISNCQFTGGGDGGAAIRSGSK